MEGYFSHIGRSISIIDRLMKMYYNHALEGFGIGWGQQFYVEYLYDHPGASAQEMAKYIRVDKATLTKVILKLSQLGYLEIAVDDKDKRIRHLYLTEQALPAAHRIKEVHASFYETFRKEIPLEELEQAERVLDQIMENINQKIWHRMEKNHEMIDEFR